MKKLFVYRTQKPTWWTEFKIHIYIALGYKVFIWGDSNLSGKHLNPIKFPSASHCSEYQDDARMLLQWSDKLGHKDSLIIQTIRRSINDTSKNQEATRNVYG